MRDEHYDEGTHRQCVPIEHYERLRTRNFMPSADRIEMAVLISTSSSKASSEKEKFLTSVARINIPHN